MKTEQWIERGTEIGNIKVGFLVAYDKFWQIMTATNNMKILVIKNELYEKIENDSKKSFFGEYKEYKYFITQSDYVIAASKNGPYLMKEIDIINFAKVFKEFIDKKPRLKINDLLYIEELELIIGIEDEKIEAMSYEELFTMMLTLGVKIDIKEKYERVKELVSWLEEERLQRIIKVAGIEIENDNNIEKEKGTFTLIGRKKLEEFFNENIIDIIVNKEKYERVGIDFPGATILYGKPGCGKTYAVNKLLEYLALPYYYISSTSIGSPYIHDTSKKIGEIFKQAIEQTPSIIVIDEMEAFLSKREGGENKSHLEEVAEFLRLIPTAIENGVLIIAMTNMIEQIDPAILRTGRFDHKIEVDMASKEEIEEMIKHKMRDLPCAHHIKIDKIAEKLVGRPLSDVTYVIREAGKISVKNNKEKIDEECFEIALKRLEENYNQNERRKIGF